MNRSPTKSTARFSSLVPAPIHPMQARLLALVAAHRFATTTQLARLTAPEYASSASAPPPSPPYRPPTRWADTPKGGISLRKRRNTAVSHLMRRNMKGGEANTAHSRQPPCGDPRGNSRIAARGQAKTGLDFSVHLSVNRKRRNTKQRNSNI